MSRHDDGFSVLLPDAQHRRDSNIMKIRNAGLGRMRVGDTTDEALWLIVEAPQEGHSATTVESSQFYPQDPKSLHPELAGRVWPL